MNIYLLVRKNNKNGANKLICISQAKNQLWWKHLIKFKKIIFSLFRLYYRRFSNFFFRHVEVVYEQYIGPPIITTSIFLEAISWV